jgi:hypothetical protein
VVLKLITGIHQFKGESAFSTWLCHDAARRRKSTDLSSACTQLQEVPIFGSHEDAYARAQLPISVRAAVCSFGYDKQHYDISHAIATRRLIPAVKSMNAGDVLVAPGVSCRHQIHVLARLRRSIRQF